jgi:hypothetical protein
VTVELACRLLESKVLLRTEVAAALADATTRGIALVQALVERIPGAIGILDAEFARWNGPFWTSLNVDERLVQQLPLGMCERLLALPLQSRDPRSGVDLAVVDPFDRHVLAEFEFCLSVAVTPARVAYPVLLQALDAVRSLGAGGVEVLLDVCDDETPAFGTRMLRVSRRGTRVGAQRGASDGAAPVVRRGFTLPSVDAPESTGELATQLVRNTLAPRRASSNPYGVEATPLPGRVRVDSEPVLRLVKQKPTAPTRRLSVPAQPRFADQGVASPEDVLEQLEQAQTPRQLIDKLHEALHQLAPCQAYFSVRAGRYALEWATGAGPSSKTVLTPEQDALLGKACQAGYFLGPLPPDGSVRALGATLGLRAREEIYVAPVNVANRPALVVVVGRFDEAFAVTRWVDSVVSRASQILSRLARNRRPS